MFKSSKKLDDPPKVMTMQEIQEDLETFCKVKLKPGRSQIIADLKVNDEELNAMTWWNAFEANSEQMQELEAREKKLNEMKDEIRQAAQEVERQKAALTDEIQGNIQRLHQLKTPK